MDFVAARIAEAAGGRLVAGDPDAAGPRRAVVDSRAIEPGDLFVGLPGVNVDGGEFAQRALNARAWGVLVGDAHAHAAAVHAAADASAATGRATAGSPAVIAVADPLAALQSLAREWRRALDCPVIGVTGSTGKTSTKDILSALLRPHLRTHANKENLNTEIGLPLSILEAESGTEVLVLEMAMRGEGQIAELVAIAEPTVGVIVNVGPVHLELLGTIERVAATKAELIRDLPAGATCVVPQGEELLTQHLRDDLNTVTFGDGGDVQLVSFEDGVAIISAQAEPVTLELPFSESYNLKNTLAAVAAARAVGVEPSGPVDVQFSSLRGELVELDGEVAIVNDCYNANPMSMRAALDHLAEAPAQRRIAVLGWMAELGPDAERFHREIGEHARTRGIDVLVAVGADAARLYGDGFGNVESVETPEAAGAWLEREAKPGDRVLIKGSRSAGLERVLGDRTRAGGAAA
ncbi:MAG TPA: UDP-N-acetylmuramoyl-tripeptide--D-alanyl-D-alanine ligase [Thermoleophilaceae bacterium]